MIRDIETRTLEMLAVALSEEYGVHVVCNGQRAFTAFSEQTRKHVITIPSVPLTDKHYRALLRGYIDHEVGHIRFTDQECLTREVLGHQDIVGSLKSIALIFEDLYVERRMGEIYPGCRRNLRTLTRLILLENGPAPVDAAELLRRIREREMGSGELPYRMWTAVSQYILYRARRAALPALADVLPRYRAPVDRLTPGLADRLEPILASVPERGLNTAANVRLAKEILDAVQTYFWNDTGPARGEALSPEQEAMLRWVLRNGGNTQESVDMAKSVERMVDETLRDVDPRLLENQVSVHDGVGGAVWRARVLPLSREERNEALQASAMMEAKMHALLQRYRLNRSGPFRVGRLNTNTLHKLFIGRSDVFTKTVEQRGLHTEIVLCVDMSGSMHFARKADLASKALFSLIHCLYHIPGLAFTVYGFFDNHVVDILRGGDRLTSRTRIVPDGGTLCGSALKFAVQTFSAARDSRRIVIMLTDGDANDGEEFEKAIARSRAAGVEFLGVGIQDEHILRYLPEDECGIIRDVRELAPEILRMLRNKLGIGS